MNIIIVDDEQMAVEDLFDSVSEILSDAVINCFTSQQEALEFIKDNPCDVAFLDIQMPGKTGMEFSSDIRAVKPRANIIFVTGYSKYALDAFSINASGYIMKPARKSDIENALNNLRIPIEKNNERLFVQCFGNFDMFYAGAPIKFSRKKAKEMFAYLVDLNGSSCTVAELCAALWEDSDDSESQRSYLRMLVADLKKVLRTHKCEDVIVIERNYFAIDKSKFDCDYYRYLENPDAMANTYKGAYMSQYSWSEVTHAWLESKK